MSKTSREAKRAIARNVECPKCGSNVGSPCIKMNGGPAISIHRVRHNLARSGATVSNEPAAPQPKQEDQAADSSSRTFEGLLAQRAEYALGALQDEYLNRVDICESPIERLMLAGLMVARPPLCERMEFAEVWDTMETEGIGIDPLKVSKTLIIPQFVVRRYRLDFAVFWGEPGRRLKMAVECDGHAFHERTKEQATRDKKRDRALTADGWIVARFTGSEIYRAPYTAATEAMDTLEQVALDRMALEYRNRT